MNVSIYSPGRNPGCGYPECDGYAACSMYRHKEISIEKRNEAFDFVSDFVDKMRDKNVSMRGSSTGRINVHFHGRRIGIIDDSKITRVCHLCLTDEADEILCVDCQRKVVEERKIAAKNSVDAARILPSITKDHSDWSELIDSLRSMPQAPSGDDPPAHVDPIVKKVAR